MTTPTDQPPAPADETPRPTGPWYEDPIELDRYLDVEVESGEGQAWTEDLDGNVEAVRRVEARDRFLECLRASGRDYRARLPEGVPGDLALRVRAALADGVRGAAPRTSRTRPWLAAVAALALLAFGVSFLNRGGGQAEAMPPEVLTAAELARMSASSTVLSADGCEDAVGTGPTHFPPIEEGGLKILRCESRGEGMVATLSRPEDLPSVGYVAVPAQGRTRGPTIGMTDLGDLVVFDLAYGSQHHYLAVGRTFLDRERARAPGRETCRACHNRSREGQDNPHRIVARSWQ